MVNMLLLRSIPMLRPQCLRAGREEWEWADLLVADVQAADLQAADLQAADLQAADLQVADLQLAVVAAFVLRWTMRRRIPLRQMLQKRKAKPMPHQRMPHQLSQIRQPSLPRKTKNQKLRRHRTSALPMLGFGVGGRSNFADGAENLRRRAAPSARTQPHFVALTEH